MKFMAFYCEITAKLNELIKYDLIAHKHVLNAPRTLRGIVQGFGVPFSPVLANDDIVMNVIKLLDAADKTTRRTMVLDTPSPIHMLIDAVKQLEDNR